ncbi:MAG: GumC family protein [Aridibacter sp.]
MERDERLLPIPSRNDLQLANQEIPPSYPVAYEDDLFSADKRSIREYFIVVYKRLPIILAITILTTAVVAFYMYRIPTVYEARTQLIVEPPKPATTNTVISLGMDPTYYKTQLQLLSSPDLMYQVVIRLGLYKQPDLFKDDEKGFLTTFKTMFSGGKNPQQDQKFLQVLNSKQNNNDSTEEIKLSPEEELMARNYALRIGTSVKVEEVERTSLVNLTVNSENPVLAAKVADGVAYTFMLQDVRREIGFDNTNLKEISKSIEDLRSTIIKQEQGYLNLLENEGIIPSNDGGAGLSSNLTTISGNWFSARDDLLKAEAQYNTVVKSGNTQGLPGDAQGPMTGLQANKLEQLGKLQNLMLEFEKKISDAETELAKLRVRYTDDYAPLKQAVKEIDKLKEQKEAARKNYSTTINEDFSNERKNAYNEVLKGLSAQVQSARIRESQLRNQYYTELRKANSQGIANTKLTTLKREIDTNHNLLDGLILKQKELELKIESTKPDNIKIASTAGDMGYEIGPQRNRNIILAFLVSLLGGIGLAFLLDYLDDSIKSSDDISRSVGLPTLALIPHHSIEKRKNKMIPSQSGNLSNALSVLEDNRSPTAEAYRHLRTSLLFSSAGKAPKKILVTSSQPSEGKTTTAINTAITLAQAGAKVVILDCDLRRPRLHSHFNMENSFGITNYLSGEKDTSKIIKDFDEVKNLKVITSGPIPPNPAELLSSQQMKNLLTNLAGTFDHIIVDSPPAISFTDAAILSTHVDGVVLVAMAGKSSVHLMRRFKQRLVSMGAKVYGVVLNGIRPNSLDYSYYGYGYTYGYYENNDDSTPVMEDEVDVSLLDEEYVEEYEEYEDDEVSIHDTNS